MHDGENIARIGIERTEQKKGKKLDRITRTVIAAQKAGMSYGMYKALHPHTPDDDQDETTDIYPEYLRPGNRVKNCAQCGKQFAVMPMRANKQYCSPECQIKHSNNARKARKAREKKIMHGVCPICGADFVKEHKSRIYCSEECFRENERRRNRERRARKKEKEAANNERT